MARRAILLFDKLVIAIGHNPEKSRYFPVEPMRKSIQSLFDPEKLEVILYNQLTANLAVKYGAKYLVRGLRNTTDFEFENSVTQLNQTLEPELETVFFITHPHYAHISSSLVREVHKYGGDVSSFLSYPLK